jgi:glycosyltransferase involved in cell wall biosynthesis
MKKIIALNAHLLTDKAGYRSAGIRNYIYQLIRHLPGASDEFSYKVFTGLHRAALPPGVDVVRTRWRTENPTIRILWEQMVQPLALRRLSPDLYHALAFAGPIFGHGRMVVTVYDVSFRRYPEAFNPLKRFYLSLMTGVTLRNSKMAIAISRSTKEDIVRFWDIPEEKVAVAYGGVSGEFHPLPDEQVEAFRRKWGLPKEYLLYLGTLEPRKNLVRLVRAYARAYRIDSSLPPLVIAGARGWYYQDIFETVHELYMDSRVIFPGFIPDEDLPLWYNAAGMFIYPSLFEGFGLPVLEAMACGTPVIASNTSSIPEVVGEAGILIPPEEEANIAEAILSLWKDRDLRSELSRRGMAQAALFSWDKTAKATVEVYRKVLNRETG